MLLVTTDYEPFWDEEDKLLFLGPWCARHEKRNKWERLEYQFLPNPWNDRKRLGDGIAYCLQVSDHLVQELTSYLNTVHQVSYGPRYWRILLGVWLNYYVQDLFARYIQVRDALDMFPDIRTLCLAPVCWVTPHDTAESVAFYQTDRYPLQLYSHVLRALERGTPERSAEFPIRATEERSFASRATLRLMARRWASRALRWSRLGRPRDIVLCDLSIEWRHVWTIVRASRFKARPLLEALPDGTSGERERGPRRNGLGSLKAGDEFERVVITSLPFNFPTVFLEGYARARDASVRGWSHPPKVLMTSVGWAFNEYFKFLAAECAERGSRLIGLQHGGMYGLGKVASWEVLERSFTDRWYAWGWSALADDSKVRDLPHPKLSDLAEVKPRRQSGQLLYVSTDFYVSLNRMHNCPMENQYEEYFAWRLQFINALPERVRGRLVVRLYPVDMGWNQGQRLKDAAPGVRLDDFSVKFVERLKMSRLAVFDHPGTTFLQGLASRMPCILFWKPSHWEFRLEAASYLDRLRDAGILFDDPVAAAQQVFRVYDDPLSWWQSERTKMARESFVDRFALAHANWQEAWVRELCSEAALSQARQSGFCA